MGVRSLGYIGIESAHVDEWKQFAVEVLGLQPGMAGQDGSLRLRMDERDTRLTVLPGQSERLAYTGWEVTEPSSLRSLFDKLQEAGFVPRYADREECAQRGVQLMATCADPAGNTLEFFYSQQQVNDSFRPSRPISGFVTGELGLGHMILYAADLDAAVDFYVNVLGFRLSDRFREQFYWLRCNPRHHSIGFTNLTGVPEVPLHIMFEVETLNDLGSTFDICLRNQMPMTTIGVHPSDELVSFYVQNPSGFEIEYGWNGVHVDEGKWFAGALDRPSIWGHQQIENGRIVERKVLVER